MQSLMLKYVISLILLLIGFTSSSYARFQCPADHDAWHSHFKESDYYVYGDDGFNLGSKIYLEKWTGSELQWRASGEIECTNGVPVCRLYFPSSGSGNKIVTDIETVDDNGTENVAPAYIVLASFLQNAYYGGGLKVTSFNKKMSNDDRVFAPNVYKRLNCSDNLKTDQSSAKETTEAYPLLTAYYKHESDTVKYDPEAAVKARVSGVLKSAYECKLNIRTHCQRLIIGSVEEAQQKYDNFELYDWDQWNFDQHNDDENEKYLSELAIEAIGLGVNLFSEKELQTTID